MPSELIDGIIDQGQTTFFEKPPELEKIFENVDCLLKDRWEEYLVDS
jgi:hypothetical protein